MSKGIPNIEIEKLFKEINNDDLNEKFLGAYPSDKINKSIMFEKMMPGEKVSFLGFKHRQKQPRRGALVEYNEHFAKKWTFF